MFCSVAIKVACSCSATLYNALPDVRGEVLFRSDAVHPKAVMLTWVMTPDSTQAAFQRIALQRRSVF